MRYVLTVLSACAVFGMAAVASADPAAVAAPADHAPAAAAVPELSVGGAGAALALLVGGALTMAERRRRTQTK